METILQNQLHGEVIRAVSKDLLHLSAGFRQGGGEGGCVKMISNIIFANFGKKDR